MANLSLAFLGPFYVTLAQTPLTAFESDKVRALLAYLAVEMNQTHHRVRLADLLWPDQAEERARTNLRHVLLKLRQAIADQAASPPFLLISRTTVQFNSVSDHWLDVAAFSQHLAASAAHAHHQLESCPPCSDHLRQAAALYRGDFLDGFYLADSPVFEEWVLLKREQFHRQALDAFYHLAGYHEQRREIEEASRYAQRQLQLEPWREEAHRQLMRLLALSGQRTTALAQFETCRRILASELGVEPAAETVALYEQIKAGEISRGAREPESQGENLSPAPQSPHLHLGGQFPTTSPSPHQVDWGEAPDITVFYGRQQEQAHLEQWLVTDRRRLVVLLGMGGMGKTALAAKTAKAVAGHFDFVFWRSLLNAPPLDDLLRACLQSISSFQLTVMPGTLDERMTLLFDYLRRYRCLLVLDNVETILQPGDRAGAYRPGYEPYGQLIQRLGETDHQSCLLLTSRERPKGLARLEADTAAVRSLQLSGLKARAGQELLVATGLSGPVGFTAALLDRHSGNPLALKLISRTIQELFNGDIAAFLAEETSIFDDIRDLLDQQFARLSTLEREIIIWLAIEREPAPAQVLAANLVHAGPRRAFFEALHSLQRRSLLDAPQQDGSAGFTLQNVVTEYIMDYLIDQLCQEIEVSSRSPEELSAVIEDSLLNRYALLKARAKEYIRHSQRRLILQPIANRLVRRLGQEELVNRLKQWLRALQAKPSWAPGYAAGNILNLLLHLGVDLRGYDFSRLAVWQAYLRGVALPNVNFSGADLTGTLFTDTFGLVGAVAFSPHLSESQLKSPLQVGRETLPSPYLAGEQLLAVGSSSGEIRLWQVAGEHPYAVLKGHSQPVWSVAFSPDGQTLASGSEDQTIRLWDVLTGQTRQSLSGHTGTVRSLAFSPDGQTLASASYDQTIRLWDAHTGQLRRALYGHTDRVRSVAFSPDGQILATGSDDQSVCLWDSRTGQLHHTLQGHSNWVWSVVFSPNGQILASGSHDQTIRLWDAHSGQLRAVLEGHTNRIWGITFSPDGQILASSSDDQTIRLWDIASAGRLRHILSGHSKEVWSVAFSPDSQCLASGSSDQTIRLWDTNTGHHLATLEGHSNWVLSVAFSPDGQTLASSSVDETIKLWDVRMGECRQTWRAPGPYAGMNITGVRGLTEAQKTALQALGAVVDGTNYRSLS